MNDRWKDEPEDPTEGQPDNPQAWHRDYTPRPPKPFPDYVWVKGEWRAPDWDDNPQRWHRD